MKRALFLASAAAAAIVPACTPLPDPSISSAIQPANRQNIFQVWVKCSSPLAFAMYEPLMRDGRVVHRYDPLEDLHHIMVPEEVWTEHFDRFVNESYREFIDLD
jgi:hypothetical protein